MNEILYIVGLFAAVSVVVSFVWCLSARGARENVPTPTPRPMPGQAGEYRR